MGVLELIPKGLPGRILKGGPKIIPRGVPEGIWAFLDKAVLEAFLQGFSEGPLNP